MDEQNSQEAVSEAVNSNAAVEQYDETSTEGRKRKRQEQALARSRNTIKHKGLVLLNTGNGKGKTTAALGLLMRSGDRIYVW